MTQGSSIVKLYNRDILRLAVALAQFPLLDSHDFYGESRSQSCGSEISIGLDLDDDARICGIGMKVKACALGQASAAIFTRHAIGKNQQDIAESREEFEQWLKGHGDNRSGGMNNLDAIWPELNLLSAVRDYPGRHDAVLLVWNGALQALTKNID